MPSEVLQDLSLNLKQGYARTKEAQDGDISAHNASPPAALPIYHVSWKLPWNTTGGHALFCGCAPAGTEKQPREGIQLVGTRDCQAVPEVRCADSQNELRWVDSL